jgi:hypothetical protein
MGTAGLLDLKNHDLIIHGGQTLASVMSLLNAAYDSGAWDGTTGITSSSLASNETLGYATAAELGISTFDGVAVSAADIIVKFTYWGDANLDGKVTSLDQSILGANWQSTNEDWAHGNFDYTLGTVDSTDSVIMAHNWQAGTGGSYGSPLVLQQPAAPEPASLGIVVVGMIALLKRRKKK